MNEQTATEWRDCADPDELAAAVADAVEVQRMRGPVRVPSALTQWVPSALTHRDDFAWRLTHGTRYQLPTWWTWRPEPPAPDDLAARATDECTLSPDRVGSPAGNDHPVTIPPADDLASLAETWRVRSDRLIRWAGDPAPQDADKVQFWLGAAAAYREAIADIDDGRPASELFTPPPVPPWPGAVLSGLVDEDGEPTWLAQAGQVRGEQVRIWHGEPWVTTHGSWADSRWVEVRAPRAVPAAPVTERVPVWEAVDRWMPGGRVICGWQWSTQTRDGSVTHDDGTFTPVHDAPTVEVLKDGGQ